MRLPTLLALLAVAGCTAAPAPTPRRVVFEDEFAGPALGRSRWNVEVRGEPVNDEQQAYVDEPAVIAPVRGAEAAGAHDGAALALRAAWRPGYVAADGRRADFVSGRMNSQGKVEVTYGTAAARMKLPAGAGFWPAFWLLGGGDWPATGEIDVMENVGDSTWTNAAMHGPGYSGDTPLYARYRFPTDSPATAWHVYSVSWYPDSLVFRVDASVFYRVTKPMVERYGRWAYDNPKFLILNLALGGGYPQAVNKASDPYHGLPPSTVDRIRNGQGVVLVDWVRVTEN